MICKHAGNPEGRVALGPDYPKDLGSQRREQLAEPGDMVVMWREPPLRGQLPEARCRGRGHRVNLVEQMEMHYLILF